MKTFKYLYENLKPSVYLNSLARPDDILFFDIETTGLSRKTNEALKNKIARHACRSAVKAGDKLSEGEIDVLLKSFKENKNVLLCPHGRPIVVVFKKTEIEKWFKRIV